MGEERDNDPYHLLANGVIGGLEIVQHLLDDLLRIRTVTHGIQKVYRSLTDADVAFTLELLIHWVVLGVKSIVTFNALITVS